MSGSFQPPGPAYFSRPTCWSSRRVKLVQRSWMSPVVRQRCATPRAQVHGLLLPHSHMLKTIGRPVAFSASRIVG